MKYVLVTGGYGFIGSNFIPFFLEAHPDLTVVNVDAVTYAGDVRNLEEVRDHERYIFEYGNICDKDFITELFGEYDFEGVIHFAAESHVDNSIKFPDEFMKTNVMGTFNLLEAARKHWMTPPTTDYNKGKRFLHVSTDEVYGSIEEGKFHEKSNYDPHSPYSASKAASDHLAMSYHYTYGMNVVITNCSNNYGPKQNHEKLIPKVIERCLEYEHIPVYGDGLNVRDWLYVEDHCKAIYRAFLSNDAGETYCIGGNNEITNIDMIKIICEVMDLKFPCAAGTYKKLITFVEDRKGHDYRYAIDASKAEKKLAWQSTTSFREGINQTVDWYINKWRKENA